MSGRRCRILSVRWSKSGTRGRGIRGSTQEPCRDYCCSAFARLRDESVLAPCDLDKTIHPLSRDSDSDLRVHRSALVPCIRLATHLLQSSALVPYLNAAANGVVRDVQGETIDIWTTKFDELERVELSTWPRTDLKWMPQKAAQRARRVLGYSAELVEVDLITSWIISAHGVLLNAQCID